MTPLEKIDILDEMINEMINEKDNELEIEEAENIRLCHDQWYITNLWNKQHKEIKELNNWINDLQAGMYVNCVYCGYRYGSDSEVPASMADVLKEHIEKCPKHPLFKANQELKRLNSTIKTLIGDALEQGIDLSVPNGKDHLTTPY